MDVDENGGLFEGYQLKLNSYDLGVDIELADAVSGCGSSIHSQGRAAAIGQEPSVLRRRQYPHAGRSHHAYKVNFCKFTNETRNGLEDSSEKPGSASSAVFNGTAAGGGYELALATEHIILVDDGSAAVALPEVPLLAVLPGTGGLTRVVDKRKVRRDLADYFCTIEEGIKGKRAVQWRLVDEVVPNSQLKPWSRERAGIRRAPRSATAMERASCCCRCADVRGRRLALWFCPRRSSIEPAASPPFRRGAGLPATRRTRRRWSHRGKSSGRCKWPANSTTPSWISGSTNSISHAGLQIARRPRPGAGL